MIVPRFQPGQRVVLVSREPYPPSPEYLGYLGTVVSYVTEPRLTAFRLRWETPDALFVRVEWDQPMLTTAETMSTSLTMLEVHLDPWQPPKEEPKTVERQDHIPPSVRTIFTDPRPVPLREFPAKPQKVKA